MTDKRPDLEVVFEHYGKRILHGGEWQKAERWVPVPDQPGYEVSDFGRVRNALTGRVQNPKPYKHGYIVVKFSGGVRERLHRVVLRAFVGEAPPGHEGSHLNGIRTDNRLVNLAWEDALTNNRRRHEHGTQVHGERQHLAKLTEDHVREIRRLHEAGATISELSRRHGVERATIRSVIRRATWKHVA